MAHYGRSSISAGNDSSGAFHQSDLIVWLHGFNAIFIKLSSKRVRCKLGASSHVTKGRFYQIIVKITLHGILSLHTLADQTFVDLAGGFQGCVGIRNDLKERPNPRDVGDNVSNAARSHLR